MSLRPFIPLLIACVCFAACDDNTSTLGMDMMPSSDLMTKTYKTYDVNSSSYEVGDSVLARTSMSYIGRFTDPVTGTSIKSDFLSQYYCLDGQMFPDSIIGDSVLSVNAHLYFTTFIGDSLTNMEIEVYELDSLLDANADYYTNIDPTKFINKDAKPIGKKWFTASDRTITDSLRYAIKGTSSDSLRQVTISLDRSIGQKILEAYRQDTTILSSANKWLHSGLPTSKGLYYKLCKGDGLMAYVKVSNITIAFDYYDAETDSVYKSASFSLPGTEEVVQATRFENKNIDKLMADTEATYLKCPAGIFTMAELPVDSINVNDTINSASITFTRYNDSEYSNASAESSFRLGIPKTVLLVRLDEYLNGFFENYNVNDNITSYITTFSSSTNTYEFDNISRLISTIQQERKNGTATENYNKILLIPVETTTSSSSSTTVVKMNHDFSMSSARLVGGKDDKVQLNVIYSRFNNNH